MSSCPPLRRQGVRGTLVAGAATCARSVLAALASALMVVCLVIAPRPAATAAAVSSPAAGTATADAATHPAPIALLVVSGWDWQRVLNALDAGGSPATADAPVATQLAALAAAGTPANLVPRTAVATPTAADGLATLTAGARAASPSVSTSRGYDADPRLLADSLAAAGLTLRNLNATDAASDTASDTTDALADLTLINATDAASSPGSAARGLPLLASLHQVAASQGTNLRVAVVSVAEASNDPQLLILPEGTTGWGGREPVASPSTHQAGWVQLTDLAPTLLAALGVPVPPAMTGQALTTPSAATPSGAGAAPASTSSPTPGTPANAGAPSPSAASPSPAAGEAATSPQNTAGSRLQAASGTAGQAEPASLATLRSLADDAARARASHAVTLPMCLLIIALGLAPLALSVHISRQGVTESRLQHTRAVALWAAALPAGAWLAALLPWWRLVSPSRSGLGGRAMLVLVPGAISLVMALALVALAGWLSRRLPLNHCVSPSARTSTSSLRSLAGQRPDAQRPATHRRRAQRPAGAAVLIAALTATLLLIDAATGARLGFNGTLGMDAVVAGRFYGMSNTAFALAGPALVVAIGVGLGSWVVAGTRWNRAARVAVAVGLPGALALALDALPVTGADVGGGLTLTVTLGVLALTLAGLRVRLRHLAALAGGAALLLAGIGMADWATGPRTHLGRLAGQLLTGHMDDAAATLVRKLTSLVAPFVTSPLAAAALVVGLTVIALAAWWLRHELAAWRSGAQVIGGTGAAGRGLAALLPVPGDESWQWIRPTLLALGTLIVVEVLVNDSGASMAWLSLAQAAPLLVLALLAAGERLRGEHAAASPLPA